MMKRLFLAALVALVMTQPSAAQGPKSERPLLIEVTFAPPVDAPLRYRLVNNRIADGKTRTAIVEQELRFQSLGDGYELTITTLSMSDGKFTVTPTTAMLNPAAAEALAMAGPITIALDPYGTPLYVVDWDAHREKLARMPEIMVGIESPENRDAARIVAERAISPMLAASAEQAVDLLVKHWPSVLGWGGMILTAGEPREYSGEVQSPIAPVLLPQQGRMVLEWTETDDVRLSLSEETDPAAIKEVLRTYFGSLGATDDPKHQAMMARIETDFTNAQNSSRMEVTFQAATGVILSARLERVFEFAVGNGTDVTTIELID